MAFLPSVLLTYRSLRVHVNRIVSRQRLLPLRRRFHTAPPGAPTNLRFFLTMKALVDLIAAVREP